MVKTYDLDPTEFGFLSATVQDLRGGTPDESAVMMRELACWQTEWRQTRCSSAQCRRRAGC